MVLILPMVVEQPLYKKNHLIYSISLIDGALYRPFVIFSHSQISKNSQSKHCHFQTFSKLNSTFTFAFITVVVFLNTRLAVILKLPYLYTYGISIRKEFNWQAGEVKFFDCERICAYLFQINLLIKIRIHCILETVCLYLSLSQTLIIFLF